MAYGLRHDIETGLLNYKSFQESLAALLRDGPADQEIALIWIDLLDLRREFSSWGWARSEAVVRRAADKLRSTADPGALLGRFGGGSFLISMWAAKCDQAGRRRIQALVDAQPPLRLRASDFNPEVAAGVAFYPADAASAEDLIRFASLAATRAGQVKSLTVMNFHADMNSLIMRDRQLEAEMQKGLDLGQFSVFYQPKVDLAMGQVLGAEALIRWSHPVRGAMTPGEFIPVAERSGLIDHIFDYVLRATLKEMQWWSSLGLSLPIISINASVANMRRDDFVDSVRGILEEIPIKPAQLELEVTESVLFDDEELFAVRVRQLKEIGVRIAIDDFGTRYTGFNVLKELPFDTMKIDKCFIRGIDRSQDMLVLCKTIVAMARQLKLHIVAEGIEEPGELEVMQKIGCDAGQGFLLQRPVSADEFTVFLRKWPEQSSKFGFATARDLRDIDPLYGIV
ncbi:MAG: GGDEF domain-containing phosphodiesterase [Terracidiphilus sp.]